MVNVNDFKNRCFSPDVILVHRTIERIFFFGGGGGEFDSIVMQNMSHNLLLFCVPTWPSYD